MSSIRWIVLLTAAFPVRAQQPPLLPITREMRIDGAAEGLTVISPFVVARDGGVVLGQAQDNQLRFFNAQGKSVATIGRRGAGPGEYQMLGKAGWIADTLWINDQQLHRTTYLSAQGKLLRTAVWAQGLRVSPKDSGALSSVGGLFPTAIYANGDFLNQLLLVQKARPGERLAPPSWFTSGPGEHPIIRVNRDGFFLRVVAWLPPTKDAICSAAFRSGNTFGVAISPFCAAGLSDVATDGSRVAIVLQHDLPTPSPSASYRIVVLGSRSDTVISKEFRYTPQPVTSSDRDSTMARMMKEAPPAIREAAKKLPHPLTHPPVRGIMVGRDSTIWVSVMTRAAGEEWLVLDPKGQTLGRVILPPRTMLREATRSMIWAIELDSDDLPSVVRYRVGG